MTIWDGKRISSALRRCSGLAVLITSMAGVCLAATDHGSTDSGGVYRLGPSDQISVHALGGDDISDKPVTIDPDGYIDLSMVGRLHAAGLTVSELGNAIASRLTRFYKDPAVSVTVTEYHSQPVSILGAVRDPGVRQLQGHKRLVEVLSQAGGVRDDAGFFLTITRRVEYGPIPLPDNKIDSGGRYNVAHANIEDLISGGNPDANIPIEPQDIVTVPRAKLVYVLGRVNKAGGFVLRDRETTALKALSLAEGLATLASPAHARILRLDSASNKRIEVRINLQKILDGKAPDPVINAEDILVIPSNRAKAAALRGAEAALQIGTGLAIYRP